MLVLDRYITAREGPGVDRLFNVHRMILPPYTLGKVESTLSQEILKGYWHQLALDKVVLVQIQWSNNEFYHDFHLIRWVRRRLEL